MIRELKEVIYDERANNGVWCRLPYPDHPRGCPNFPQCPSRYPDFKTLQGYKWFLIIEEFDLASHAEKMKEKHPEWTDRQCRNLLYWQNGVRSRLEVKAKAFYRPLLGDILLEIPEACGVNMFETMSKAGITLQRKHPNYIVKGILVGRLLSPFSSKTPYEKLAKEDSS